jgi:phage gp36-like protein
VVAPYVTVDEVRSAVTRDLNRLAGSAAVMSDDQLAAAIDNAQAQVDGKLRRLYLVPFNPVPDLVKSIVIDIAGWLATMNYRQEKEIPEVDPIVRRYNRAHDLLCCIAEGHLALPDAAGTGIEPRINGIGAPIAPRTKLFQGRDFGISPWALNR